MRSYIISGIKIVIQLILFVAFLIHFGIPSLEKYGKEETISVTSEAETNGIDAPAVTISVFYGAQGTGWKSAQGQFTWDTFNLVEHCENIKMPDLQLCMRNDTFEFHDFIREMYFGFPKKSASILRTSDGSLSLPTVPLSFEEDLSFTSTGRHFTIKASKIMTTQDQDWMVLILKRKFSFFIFLHDEEYFVLDVNSFGPPSILRMYVNLNQSHSHYYEISLTIHKKLNIGRRPCVEDPDYSFKSCVKNSLSEKVTQIISNMTGKKIRPDETSSQAPSYASPKL